MYSKIVSVEVVNFMVYAHGKIMFDEGNIINIKGYNSGGKSTMLKAIAVCLMNMYPKSQAKFIRHGEKYFRIIVKFDDGVSIVRDKYISGQSLYELYKDGECLFTTKEGGRLTKVDTVPQTIQDYLGLCMLSNGCLNYQVRQDPLWLIETTGSENYASLNEILKTEELSRAGAMINSDKNQLNSEITGIEASLQETTLALKESEGYSADLLDMLEARERKVRKLADRYQILKKMYAVSCELKGIEIPPAIGVLDTGRYEMVMGLYGKAEEISGIEITPEVATIDMGRYEKAQSISAAEKALRQIEIPPVVDGIDLEKSRGILEIQKTFADLGNVISEIRKITSVGREVSSELKGVVSTAEKKGIKFVECENCGTYIEVSIKG